jgi:hypothetical protein
MPKLYKDEQARRLAQYNNKRAKYFASIGQPLRIPAEPVINHVRYLKSMGMSNTQIARAAGVSTSSISDFNLGRRKTGVPVKYAEAGNAKKILAVKFTPPPTSKSGAQMDATGTRRRLQALTAKGFPLYILGEYSGKQFVQLNEIQLGTRRNRTHVAYAVRQEIAALYEKLADVDPWDLGLTARSIHRAQTAARSHDWAPPMCWDEDTIDDPNAIPEWTGDCGSASGYRIHVRDDIPVCPPCRVAMNEYRAEEKERAAERKRASRATKETNE